MVHNPPLRERLEKRLQAMRGLLGTAAGLGIAGVMLHKLQWVSWVANTLVVVAIVLAVIGSAMISATKFQLWRLEPWAWRKIEALLKALIIYGLITAAIVLWWTHRS